MARRNKSFEKCNRQPLTTVVGHLRQRWDGMEYGGELKEYMPYQAELVQHDTKHIDDDIAPFGAGEFSEWVSHG